MPIVREFVSKNVYRTPSGLYFDQRTGKRISGAKGRAADAASKRIGTRVRDEKGKLSFKIIHVRSDSRDRETGATRYNQPVDVATSYEPSKDINAALESARRNLDEDEPERAHFNVGFLEEIEVE